MGHDAPLPAPTAGGAGRRGGPVGPERPPGSWWAWPYSACCPRRRGASAGLRSRGRAVADPGLDAGAKVRRPAADSRPGWRVFARHGFQARTQIIAETHADPTAL